MRKKIVDWLGREFIALSCEGRKGASASEQTTDIFLRCEEELGKEGLSLHNTVRTRLWARDGESRNQGSSERVRILSGRSRAASSSFISPGRFDSDALVALDLLALRPSQASWEKKVQECDPPRNFIRYLTCDSLMFISGVTSTLPALTGQIAQVLQDISTALGETGSSWESAVKVSFFLHQSQNISNLKALFKNNITAGIPHREYTFVDGYSSAGKLIEIEVTAELPTPFT